MLGLLKSPAWIKIYKINNLDQNPSVWIRRISRIIWIKIQIIQMSRDYAQMACCRCQPKGLINYRLNYIQINIKLDGHPSRALIDQHTTRSSLISTTFPFTNNLTTIEVTNEKTVNLILQRLIAELTPYIKFTL